MPPDSIAKITDFGISAIYDQIDKINNTLLFTASQLGGTKAFMPLEMIIPIE